MIIKPAWKTKKSNAIKYSFIEKKKKELEQARKVEMPSPGMGVGR